MLVGICMASKHACMASKYACLVLQMHVYCSGSFARAFARIMARLFRTGGHVVSNEVHRSSYCTSGFLGSMQVVGAAPSLHYLANMACFCCSSLAVLVNEQSAKQKMVWLIYKLDGSCKEALGLLAWYAT